MSSAKWRPFYLQCIEVFPCPGVIMISCVSAEQTKTTTVSVLLDKREAALEFVDIPPNLVRHVVYCIKYYLYWRLLGNTLLTLNTFINALCVDKGVKS